MTPAEGRRFGLQVGAAFLVLAALLWWRGRVGVAPWLAGLGGSLVVAGIAIPAHLGPVFRAWMALALVLSKVTTPIFMGVIFFGVIMPIGLVMRALGRSPLRHAGMEGGRWVPREAAGARTSMERQF